MPEAGLVPPSTIADAMKFLRGDGTWGDSTKGLVKLKETQTSDGGNWTYVDLSLPDGYDWEDVNFLLIGGFTKMRKVTNSAAQSSFRLTMYFSTFDYDTFNNASQGDSFFTGFGIDTTLASIQNSAISSFSLFNITRDDTALSNTTSNNLIFSPNKKVCKTMKYTNNALAAYAFIG